MSYIIDILLQTLVWGFDHPQLGTIGSKAAEAVIETLRRVAQSMEIEWEDLPGPQKGDRQFRLRSISCGGLNVTHEAYAWREVVAVVAYCHSSKKVQIFEEYLNWDSEAGWDEESQLDFDDFAEWRGHEFDVFGQEHQLLVNGLAVFGRPIQTEIGLRKERLEA